MKVEVRNKNVRYMNDEQKFKDLYIKMFKLCERNSWGDPFSYSRAKEIMMSIQLKHKLAETYAGPDGFDNDGACEYKSTIGKVIQGTYNGISVQSTLEEQIDYIKNEKIGKYKNHYYARFENGEIQELYLLKSQDVLDILIPKVVKKFKNSSHKKDPRIGVMVTKKEIYEKGQKII